MAMTVVGCSIFGAFLLFLVIYLILPLIRIILRYLRADRSYSAVKRLREGPDDWAVVTGGTDGIGLAYAHELAGLGFNICLISRTAEKLEAVASALREKWPVQTRCVQVDFTRVDIYGKIREAFQGLKVVVLVNNVGMTQAFPCEVHKVECSESFYADFVNCNMTSALITTRLALKDGGMLERRRGLVINISSASALFPIPLASMYCATKSFLDFFSRGIEQELSDSGVTVQTVLPFYVLTKFIGRFKPPRMLAPTAEAYVKSALAMVGVESRTHGCLSHAIQGLLMSLPPDWIRYRLAHRAHAYRAKVLRGQ